MALTQSNTPVHVPLLSSLDLGYVRWPGAGLGNLLFPISRAIIAQHNTGGILLFATMRQIKLGPYLRREDDKRTYGEIFQGRSLDEWLQWIEFRFSYFLSHSSKYIFYSGIGNYFYDLHEYNELISDFIEARVRLPIVYEEFDIALHLRSGDFSDYDAKNTGQSIRNPRSFYQAALVRAVKVVNKKNPKIVVFSDSPACEVKKYVGFDVLNIEQKVNALHSIMKMSRAKVIITSRSTFSLWAQFLGNTCAIWPKNFDLARYKYVDPKRDVFV